MTLPTLKYKIKWIFPSYRMHLSAGLMWYEQTKVTTLFSHPPLNKCNFLSSSMKVFMCPIVCDKKYKEFFFELCEKVEILFWLMWVMILKHNYAKLSYVRCLYPPSSYTWFMQGYLLTSKCVILPLYLLQTRKIYLYPILIFMYNSVPNHTLIFRSQMCEEYQTCFV